MCVHEKDTGVKAASVCMPLFAVCLFPRGGAGESVVHLSLLITIILSISAIMVMVINTARHHITYYPRGSLQYVYRRFFNSYHNDVYKTFVGSSTSSPFYFSPLSLPFACCHSRQLLS